MTITARRCTLCRRLPITRHPATGKGEWCRHCDEVCRATDCPDCKGRAA